MAIDSAPLDDDDSCWGDTPGIAAVDVDAVASYFERETIRCIADPHARSTALRTLAHAWWQAVAAASGRSNGGHTINVTVQGQMNADTARRTGSQVGMAAGAALSRTTARNTV